MTILRQRMIEDLKLRNYSPRTIETYVSRVVAFAKFHRRSPDQLGPADVRSFQLHMLEAGTSWSLFNQSVCALKFLYRVTLRVPWHVEQIPYGRKPRPLPVVLSQDEVVRLIEAVPQAIYRMALLTTYAAGLRISETMALRAEHIDSARMLVHVEQGKGQKPRLVPLSKVLLCKLRTYWRDQRPRIAGSTWLFPSEDPAKAIHETTIEKACQRARVKAGITKRKRCTNPVLDGAQRSRHDAVRDGRPPISRPPTRVPPRRAEARSGDRTPCRARRGRGARGCGARTAG